ncbi:MAG: hypothetical protein ABID84_04460 [Chloroflexota bacterium]
MTREMLDAWFATPPGEGEDAATVARLAAIDECYRWPTSMKEQRV